MRILLLSFYFPPDLSACSFRMKALVESLDAVLPPGAELSLLTTLPNRYGSFSPEAPQEEMVGRCRVRRFTVPSHASGMLDQVRAYRSFVGQVLRHLRGHEYDLVFATSSRLMTAALGAVVARWKRARLHLDIRDIFVDTMADLLAGRGMRHVVQVFGALERWTIESADEVNLVSAGFTDYFEDRYPHRRFTYITNGIDSEFVRVAPPRESRVVSGQTLQVVYAGNLGDGQGLHQIVPPLAQRLGGRVHFRIFGDGGRRAVLEREVAERALENVEIVPPVDRSRLIEVYESADVLFLHLNNHLAFERVLPSKIFEYAAMGKPIWAGVGGFAARFIRSEIANAAVFRPGDVSGALVALDTLQPGFAPRDGFVERYRRERVSEELAARLLQLAGDDT